MAAAVEEARGSPETFLRLIEKSKRGRLKMYIGHAAGVGKTYQMLEDAHALQEKGADLVVGVVETHGRAETAAKLEGLTVLPRRKVRYKDRDLEEMDLPAILERKPEIVLVDELAHTNVPGAENEKRYQDVEEILAAGISVMTTVNIQHFESVQEIVSRVTHVEVRERVPLSRSTRWRQEKVGRFPRRFQISAQGWLPPHRGRGLAPRSCRLAPAACRPLLRGQESEGRVFADL